jgi:hypothetical protein
VDKDAIFNQSRTTGIGIKTEQHSQFDGETTHPLQPIFPGGPLPCGPGPLQILLGEH